MRYVGRTLVSSDGSVSFDWVGTYWETRFTGGRLSLIVSETGTSYYNVFVDDELIAPAGQVPSQAPQEIQASEITYAIVISSLYK